MLRLLAVLAVLLALPGVASGAPFERHVDHALAVHVPPAGLQALGDAVAGVVPTTFPVLETAGTFECSDDTSVDYTLAPVDLLLSTDAVVIETAADVLDITVYATLDSTASTLDVTGDCTVLEDLDETCGLQIPTTAVEVHLAATLVATGGQIDALVDPVEVSMSPIGNPLSDCTLESAVGTLLGQDPEAINDLLLGAVEPSLEGVPAEVEAAVEDALNGLAIETTIDLLGTPLDLALEPARIDLAEQGIVVGMQADLAGYSAPCADPTAYAEPATAWPGFDDEAAGTSLVYDAGLLLGRDFVDELLLSIWGSGALCMQVDELQGVPLRGALAGSFFGDEVTELIGEDAPATLVFEVPEPPLAWFSEDQPAIAFDLDGSTLDLVAELDHRQARVLEVGIDGEIGLDVGFDGTTIAPTLAVEPGSFLFTESYSELVGPGYSQDLTSLLDTVLAIAIPDDALAEVPLPAPLGVEIDELFWIPTPTGSWHGAYAVLDLSGVEPIEVQGCSGDQLGCDGSGGGAEIDVGEALGCDQQGAGCGDEGSSCATGTLVVPTWPWLPLLAVITIVGLRRRD